MAAASTSYGPAPPAAVPPAAEQNGAVHNGAVHNGALLTHAGYLACSAALHLPKWPDCTGD
jgi:hypothetical protein